MEKISLSQNGDVTVVTFTQPKFLDDGDIQQMGDELFQVVDSGVEKILLDMSTVDFLSSAALNRFIMLHKKVKNAVNLPGFTWTPPAFVEVLTKEKLAEFPAGWETTLDEFVKRVTEEQYRGDRQALVTTTASERAELWHSFFAELGVEAPPGGELRLVSVTSEIEKIFAITRLNTLFSIHPDLPSGLASF